MTRAVFTGPWRWTPGRKETVVRQVRLGEVTPEAVEQTFGISADELASWSRRFDRFGQDGLRQMRLQELRP